VGGLAGPHWLAGEAEGRLAGWHAAEELLAHPLAATWRATEQHTGL